jgi:hypothetical protein
MKKPPKNLPDCGDLCRLRGRLTYGILVKYDPESLWATVAWIGQIAPKIVHLHELETWPRSKRGNRKPDAEVAEK